MFKLGVNIDHVATLRQARVPSDPRRAAAEVYPDPVKAALICQKAGAHSIVMHLREDRRHVQDADVFKVKDAIRIKFNLEMSIAPDIVDVARRLAPHQVTLVPERRMERTTEGGLDLFKKESALRRAFDVFRGKRISISLFIDPDRRQVEQAGRLGADAVEFHTGDYSHQLTRAGAERELKRLAAAVKTAGELGLTSHAGHGLDFQNVRALRRVRALDELNIGYSIVTRSLWVGLDAAVREMRVLVS